MLGGDGRHESSMMSVGPSARVGQRGPEHRLWRMRDEGSVGPGLAARGVREFLRPLFHGRAEHERDGPYLAETRLVDPSRGEVGGEGTGNDAARGAFERRVRPHRTVVAPVALEQPRESPGPERAGVAICCAQATVKFEPLPDVSHARILNRRSPARPRYHVFEGCMLVFK